MTFKYLINLGLTVAKVTPFFAGKNIKSIGDYILIKTGINLFNSVTHVLLNEKNQDLNIY